MDWVQQSTRPKVMLLFAKLPEGGHVEPGAFSSSPEFGQRNYREFKSDHSSAF